MAAATEYERIADLTHKMANDMARADKSSEGMSLNFGTIFKAAVGFDLIKNAVQKIIEQSTVYQALQNATSRTNLRSYDLTQREMRLTSERTKLEVSRLHGSEQARHLASQRLEFVNKELEAVKKQVVFAKELQDIGRVRLGLLGMMATAATTMWYNSRQFNQNLIEANASWEHRNKLILDTLVAQTQLGISFDDLTKSAAALVHYGMDTSDTFETNLRLVAQMEQGLGVSVGESARLASIVERQLKGSFEGVAHTIAQIVDDTALAGDEAARLATNIATALGRLRPGMAGAMPEVVRLVGRYESALKEVGGQSGAFQQLLTQLTTPEGLVGAGALGVNPEFIATSQGVQQVMDRFAQYGEMLVGQSQGWERQMRLQALAQIFNVTADQANQMLIAIQRANAAQMGQISVQERWKEQLNATNSGIQRLGNSLMGLLQGAMYPVVFLVGALANRLADVVEWFTQTKEAVYILGTGILIATAALTISMVNLARALWQTVMASVAAQAVMSRYAALQGAGALTGGAGLSARGIGFALGRWLVGPLLALATPLGLIVVAVTAIAAVLVWKIAKNISEIKRLNEENAAAQKIIMAREDKLAAERQARIYNVARYSADPTAELLKVYEMRVQDIIARGDVGWTAKRAMIAEAKKEFDADVLKARFTRTQFTPLMERTEQEQKIDKELSEIGGKTLSVNEKMEKHMIQRLRQENERLQEQRDEAAKDRVWNPMRWFVPGALPER